MDIPELNEGTKNVLTMYLQARAHPEMDTSRVLEKFFETRDVHMSCDDDARDMLALNDALRRLVPYDMKCNTDAGHIFIVDHDGREVAAVQGDKLRSHVTAAVFANAPGAYNFVTELVKVVDELRSIVMHNDKVERYSDAIDNAEEAMSDALDFLIESIVTPLEAPSTTAS